MIVGKKLLHYRIIDSTNEEARRLIKLGEGEGLVVIAATQTKGKGKPGSKWFSPKGNLYISVVLKPYKNPKELGVITLLTALAARTMIGQVAKLPTVIKWPNDLLVHGKKVGGILTERLTSGHLIVGIGLNINSRENSFPAGLRRLSTSLRIESGQEYNLERCIKLLLQELDRRYLAYLAKV